MVFQHVGLSWITNNNNHIKFEMDVEYSQWMEKVYGIIKPFAQN